MQFPHLIEFIIGILVALTIHEAAHAYIAHLLGDNTAKYQGRISLNPIKHLVIFIGIGWGKPVPVNPQYFKNPKRDQALVALAGPMSNFILAIFLAIPLNFNLIPTFHSLLNTILEINVTLCALNLLPIPPLDGSKILAIFIPQKNYYKYTSFLEANLTYIILLFMADIYLFQDFFGFSVFSTILNILTGAIKTLIFMGT